MQNKNGLSKIVTTVLIILIGLTAVSALWAVVIKPLTENNFQASPSNEACLANNIEISTCQKIVTDAGQPGYNIAYQRTNSDPSKSNLNDLKIVLELDDGSSTTGDEDGLILSGEVKTSQVITDNMAKKAYIISILGFENSEKKTACKSSIISCENEKIEFTQTNPNQIILNETNQTQQNSTNQTQNNSYPGCFGEYAFPGGEEGPTSSCGIINTSEACNAFDGCGWVEEPSCGDGLLTHDEECDASSFGFYWYLDINIDNHHGNLSYTGDFLPVNCSNGDHAFIKHITPGDAISTNWSQRFKCNSCKLEEVTSSCQLCGNGNVEGAAGEQCDGGNIDFGSYSNNGWNPNIQPIGECASYDRTQSFPDNHYNCPVDGLGNPNPNCYISQNEPACDSNCQLDFSSCQ